MTIHSQHEELILREATLADAPALRELIASSARALCREDYSPEQIEAAIGTAWGLDTQLLVDRTYFVVEANGQLIACGGWSKRRTLFGGDGHAVREPELLDPRKEAARVRAFFVHPSWARRGVGRMLLLRCEQEARDAGFHAVQLVATLPGHRLYRAYGYSGDQRVSYPLEGALTIDFVPMTKAI